MDILYRKGIPLRKEKQKGNQAPLYDTLNNSNRQILALIVHTKRVGFSLSS